MLLIKFQQKFWSFITGVTNSNLVVFLEYPRAKINMLCPYKECFYQTSKLNEQNCGIWVTTQKLLRATFGPRTLCCASLTKLQSKKFNAFAIFDHINRMKYHAWTGDFYPIQLLVIKCVRIFLIKISGW